MPDFRRRPSGPPPSAGFSSRGTEEEGLNVAPALSPDGKKFIFISSRDLFSIEMFMGDTKTGKVTRKITKTAVDPHFQSIQFINSAGSWDADGNRFVFGAVSAGKPVLAFLDAEGGQDRRTRSSSPNLGEILNPTWSPDGKRIAFSALTGGYTDLYIYDLETKELKNMTYGPVRRPPAGLVARRPVDRVRHRAVHVPAARLMSIGSYQLALLDPETGEIKHLASLQGRQKHQPPVVGGLEIPLFRLRPERDLQCLPDGPRVQERSAK